jgi:hypothetical protein
MSAKGDSRVGGIAAEMGPRLGRQQWGIMPENETTLVEKGGNGNVYVTFYCGFYSANVYAVSANGQKNGSKMPQRRLQNRNHNKT